VCLFVIASEARSNDTFYRHIGEIVNLGISMTVCDKLVKFFMISKYTVSGILRAGNVLLKMVKLSKRNKQTGVVT